MNARTTQAPRAFSGERRTKPQPIEVDADQRPSETNTLTIPDRELDATDLIILAALQENGRLSNVDLSAKTKITAPPCLRRTKALEEIGYIRGYHAKLDPRKLGFEVTAFVHIGLCSQSLHDTTSFERAVARWPCVRECHAVSGQTDFLLKCRARTLAEFQAFLTDTLMTLPNVKTVKSSLAVRVVKDEPGVPLSLSAKR